MVYHQSRASLVKMVFFFFLGFSMGKILLPLRSVRTPKIYHSSRSRVLPVKQAQIQPKKPKRKLRPFLTIFAAP
jgi:hypothetical protein